MNISSKPHRQTLVTILVFLGCLGIFSAFAHFAIVRLAPVSIYVGALMISPALAAALTLKLRGRRIADMPWKWGSWSANIKGYLIPIAYVSAAYGLIWLLGLGTPGDPDTIAAWQDELGLGGQPAGLAIALMIALLATVQFIKSLGSIAGEEIGWRGFLVWELRKIAPFQTTCLVSGTIWAVWHYPVIIAYGGGNTLFQLACFTLMIISMSVIMTYYTFRSGSLWPAVMFHAAHNIYIQKIYTPLAIEHDNARMWTDEYGLMVPLAVTVIAIVYWRRAKSAGL